MDDGITFNVLKPSSFNAEHRGSNECRLLHQPIYPMLPRVLLTGPASPLQRRGHGVHGPAVLDTGGELLCSSLWAVAVAVSLSRESLTEHAVVLLCGVPAKARWPACTARDGQGPGMSTSHDFHSFPTVRHRERITTHVRKQRWLSQQAVYSTLCHLRGCSPRRLAKSLTSHPAPP